MADSGRDCSDSERPQRQHAGEVDAPGSTVGRRRPHLPGAREIQTLASGAGRSHGRFRTPSSRASGSPGGTSNRLPLRGSKPFVRYGFPVSGGIRFLARLDLHRSLDLGSHGRSGRHRSRDTRRSQTVHFDNGGLSGLVSAGLIATPNRAGHQLDVRDRAGGSLRNRQPVSASLSLIRAPRGTRHLVQLVKCLNPGLQEFIPGSICFLFKGLNNSPQEGLGAFKEHRFESLHPFRGSSGSRPKLP